MFNIKFKRYVHQLKELMYKRPVGAQEVAEAENLIEKAVLLSETGFFSKGNKRFLKEQMTKILDCGRDHLKAGEFASDYRAIKSEPALEWYRSADLKEKLYEKISQKWDWLYDEEHQKNLNRVMRFETFTNALFVKTQHGENPYQEEIDEVRGIKRVEDPKILRVDFKRRKESPILEEAILLRQRG
ncbi:MAG: hypothetical protein JW812_03565 [Alphaproteobacteria bacterium]|nr:hypothetical protein [Alphaproteobacteria bacterium]MBN2779930.1 hypothetical protein [Alphaproteobacteria bacterium]